jgi:large subunit ribosomal protein L11e
MDFYVVMTRPGDRVRRRRRAKATIGATHRIKAADTMRWYRTRFEGIIR